MDSAELHRATWASFSSRPRALQPKRRQQHGALCRSKRARHAVSVQGALPCRPKVRGTWSRIVPCIVRRGPAFQAAQGPVSPSAGNDMAPLAAGSVQCTLPRRPQVFADRVSLLATWASFSSRPRVLQPKRRQRHCALCRNERARCAAVPSTGMWQARSRIVRRGPAFQAA